MWNAAVGGKDEKFVLTASGTFQMTYQYLVFKLDGDVYALTYSSLKAYKEHLPEFEAILASLQFAQ